MGTDWEDILGAEGDDLQDAYDDNVDRAQRYEDEQDRLRRDEDRRQREADAIHAKREVKTSAPIADRNPQPGKDDSMPF